MTSASVKPRRLALVLTFALGVFAAGGAAQAQDRTATSPEVRRWSPVVSDLDEAIHLYRDILGFELGEIKTDDVDSYVYTAFNIDPAVRPRHAVFHSALEQRALSVVEVPGVDFSQPPDAVRPAATLINANGRFDIIVERLRAAGYTVFDTKRLGEDGIEGAFLDRDGHLYALYEIPYANAASDTE